jgi:transposase
MPYRTFSREQDWLLPPSLGDLLASDHLVRFVAEFVDLLELEQVGILAEPAVEGVPSYHPRVLLGVWLYGFMVRVRSSRKLEAACRENVAFMWLTGLQRPDHVTLWRFYKHNRKVMRQLLKRTVCLATEVGLVDFALQAVDGSRVAVSSLDSLKGRAAVEKLLAQVEAAIVAMEQANECEDGPDGRTRPGPHALLGKHEMRERLQRALAALAELEKAPTAAADKSTEPRADTTSVAESVAEASPSQSPSEGQVNPGRGLATVPLQTSSLDSAGQRPADAEAQTTTAPEQPAKPAQEPRISASDPEAVWIKGRHGLALGYNGQAVVDSKAQIIVAADLVACGGDGDQLAPMLDEAQAMTGRSAQVVATDTGYFSMIGIAHAQELGIEAYVPERRATRKDGPTKNPYHKEHFVYDAVSDTFTCPLGQFLTYYADEQRQGRKVRVFKCHTCSGCPAQASGECTKSPGRRITLYGHEVVLKVHAAKMQTEEARTILRQRSAIVEPVFAIFREQLGLVRFLVRGLENVKAEWRLLAIAHNLRKLWKLWWRPKMRHDLAVG